MDLAIPAGFEPATSAVTGLHSSQLNYETIKGRRALKTPCACCFLVTEHHTIGALDQT